MGRSDYYKPGDHNAICDICGFKFKMSELYETWDGYQACKINGCWNPRQPQDYVKGVQDDQSVDVSRPDPPNIFVPESETGPIPPPIYP